MSSPNESSTVPPKDPIDQTPRPTRRKLLGGLGTISAVALAGCSGGGSDVATDSPRPDMMADTNSPTPTATETPMEVLPDVPILNYALTLEHLENAFYRDGLEMFSDDELMEAETLSTFDEAIRRDVPKFLEIIGKHEAAHVDVLSATIADLGGTAVEEGSYDFGYATPSEFLAVGKALENTGVSAYAGAAPAVANNEILAAAAGIHSVEARHASFLNLVNDASPFPDAVDDARSLSEVLKIAGQFVPSEVDVEKLTREEGSNPKISRKAENDVSDIDVLNYALTLEHLENAFYREGLETFSEDELTNAEVLSRYGEKLRSSVPDHLAAVGNHEAAHVEALTATIEDLGGDPVAEATYDFGYETPSEYLGVARALENTGVAAYAGAAPTVSNDEIFAAALSIHSVEARHASFLNELNVKSPFPVGVDEAKTMAEVTEIAKQFIVED